MTIVSFFYLHQVHPSLLDMVVKLTALSDQDMECDLSESQIL